MARSIAPVVLTVAAVAISPGVAFGITPLSGGPVAGTTIPVHTSEGDQDDPHIDGDIVTYSNKSPGGSSVPWAIGYFHFPSGADTAIPPGGFADLLSDVSGQRISFSRVMSDRTAAMLFDVATGMLTEIDPVPGSARFGTAIGGDTVVFVDALPGTGGDVFAYDLATGGPAVNVSGSPDNDENPGISPAGDAIVWMRSGGVTGFDILKAVRTAGAWGSPQPVSATLDPEENPDTDGVTVVYDSTRAGKRSVFFQPLAGGAETELEIAGAQSNPAINEGVVSFESTSAPGAKSDIYVYVIATNTLYQVTNTPDIGEHLNDIDVLPGGVVRVAWAADEGEVEAGIKDIHAITYSLPGAGDTMAPAITITTPADGGVYTLDHVVAADYTCTDEASGSGIASCAGPVAVGAPIVTSAIGAHSFAVTGSDNAGNTATLTHVYNVAFCVRPFESPVNDLPTVNRVNAGRAVPVKFSLCGNQGLGVLAPGYPASQQIACDSTAPVDGVEETMTAGNSGLSYDPVTDQYTYIWKTEKRWNLSCRQLVLKLADGSLRRANFQFR